MEDSLHSTSKTPATWGNLTTYQLFSCLRIRPLFCWFRETLHQVVSFGSGLGKSQVTQICLRKKQQLRFDFKKWWVQKHVWINLPSFKLQLVQGLSGLSLSSSFFLWHVDFPARFIKAPSSLLNGFTANQTDWTCAKIRWFPLKRRVFLQISPFSIIDQKQC